MLHVWKIEHFNHVYTRVHVSHVQVYIFMQTLLLSHDNTYHRARPVLLHTVNNRTVESCKYAPPPACCIAQRGGGGGAHLRGSDL